MRVREHQTNNKGIVSPCLELKQCRRNIRIAYEEEVNQHRNRPGIKEVSCLISNL